MSARVLLVEDEPGLVLTLSDRLQAEGFEVESTASAREALKRLGERSYDIVLLDLMLPDGSGFEVCRRLRERDPVTPVLMLTALGATEHRVRGLEQGADDYLAKPFDSQELVARLRALLRRSRAAGGGDSAVVLSLGGISLDTSTARCTVDGREVELSARLFGLLRYLLSHPNQVLSRDRLLNEVWGYSSLPNTRTVDVHVGWLRRRIEVDPARPRRLLTVHGLGYKLVP